MRDKSRFCMITRDCPSLTPVTLTPDHKFVADASELDGTRNHLSAAVRDFFPGASDA